MPRFDFNPKQYPTDPGCYLMKDGSGTIMYVGKAKNLRKRLASYFHKSRKRAYIRNMINRIRAIDVIIVNNETESLILENNLIKRYRPATNRALMAERTGYPYIVLTNDPLPRFVPYRKNRVNRELGYAGKEAADRRFGPYINTHFRNTLLDFVIEHFQIRTCHPMPKSVCLRYHLGVCGGVCQAKQTEQDYLDAVAQATAFLTSNHVKIARQMRKWMDELSDNLLFEKAAKVRDQLTVIDQALETQIVERDVSHDQAVLWFDVEGGLIMRIERGMLWHLESIESATHPEPIPAEVITNQRGAAEEVVKSWLVKDGNRVKIVVPSTGVKAQLLVLCRRNYAYQQEKSRAQRDVACGPICI